MEHGVVCRGGIGGQNCGDDSLVLGMRAEKPSRRTELRPPEGLQPPSQSGRHVDQNIVPGASIDHGVKAKVAGGVVVGGAVVSRNAHLVV